MIINLIAAKSLNNVIGLKGKLPWDIPSDWNYFLDKTKGKHIIMGRITYEELTTRGVNNWTKIVLSKNKNLSFNDAIIFSDLKTAIAELEKSRIKEVFIIGGVVPFEEGLEIADNLYLTFIQKVFEGDRYFPINKLSGWTVTSEKNRCSDATDLKFTEWKKNQI